MIDQLYEGVFGGNTDEEDAKSQEYLDAALAEWDNISAPDLNWLGDYVPPSKVVAPTVDGGKDVVYEGVDPRLAELALQGDTAFNDISVDPRLKDTQMGSLDALRELAESGGMTAADEANLNRIQSEVGAADRGRREAIKSNMAARGMGGSGLELLQMLDSSQAATDRANQSGLDIAGMAEQRALDAMVRGGSLAGDIRGQDFGEAAQVAAANDAIDRFNTANTNQTSQFNAGTVNDMGQFNAGNALQTAQFNKGNELDVKKYNASNTYDANKTNTGYSNDAAYQNWVGKQGQDDKETFHNNYTLPQTGFQNQTTIASGKANAYGAGQNYWQGQGDREAAEAAGKAGLVATVGAAAVSDEREKRSVSKISDAEIDEFLGAIEPKRYRYKKPDAPGQAPGERLGFMLQDVADTKLGKDITRERPDGTLEYDKDNLMGVVLASLAKKGKAA
jgi:hypothetical protein